MFAQKTEIGFKDVTAKTTVPDNHLAKLMYYFKCVCNVFEMNDMANIKRLIDFQNYFYLTRADQRDLFNLCLIFNPRLLENKVFFCIEDCGGLPNRFVELSLAEAKVAVVSDLLIGGLSRKVTNVMFYEKQWMDHFYDFPLLKLSLELTAPPPPPPKTSNNSSLCTIL